MRRIVAAGSFLVVMSLVPMSAQALERENVAPNGRIPIADCISQGKKLDALFVVDQSISLKRNLDRSPGTDPNDERVTALKAVLNVLQTKTARDADEEPIVVNVAHAGFGADFNLHEDWTRLDETGFQQLLAKIEKQADLDSENFTRYHKALEGAIKTFESRPSDNSACRMLVWFSDGKHDDNNKGEGFSSGEQKQIRETICGVGGLADRLRSNGIFTIAAGLNSDDKQLELMKLVSESVGSLSLNGSEFLGQCGELPPYGKFEVARNSDSLVETLFNLVNTSPGGKPLSPTESTKCDDGTPNCSEISFDVTDQVDQFTMLVDRKASSVAVELRTGPGKKFELFSEVPLTDANTKASVLSSNRLYLDVQRRKNGSINGTWKLRFTGAGNEDANALVKFIGKSTVVVESRDGAGSWSILEEIDRYDTQPVRIDARINTSEVEIRSLKAFIRTVASGEAAGNNDLPLTPEGGNGVAVSADALQRVLTSGELARATKAELVVRISGSIPGLVDTVSGEDVPVEFKDEVFEFLIGNGSEWPQFLEQLEVPKIVGTDKRTIRMLFKGADGRDTKVTFKDELDADLGLEFISGQACEIPASEVKECVLEVKPDKSSFGRKTFVASAVYSDVNNPDVSQGVDIDVTLDMEKPASTCDGLIAAIALVLVFFLVQGVQRYFFAVLMSRFAALNAVDRRARLDIEISDSGHITGPSGSMLSIKSNDEGFVYENYEAVSGFYLFGYQFDTSVMRTFMHSTDTPRGLVSQEGKHVFGSAGVQMPTKKSEASIGLVNLSLRGQWAIGINGDELLKLADGVNSVPAELVVYLDPVEKLSIEQQLSDLNFDIAGGQFAQELSAVISNVRERGHDNNPGDDPRKIGGDNPWDPVDVSHEAINDPFSSMSGAAMAEPDEGALGSRKSRFSRRSEKKREEIMEDDRGTSPWVDPNDPFA